MKKGLEYPPMCRRPGRKLPDYYPAFQSVFSRPFLEYRPEFRYILTRDARPISMYLALETAEFVINQRRIRIPQSHWLVYDRKERRFLDV